MFRSAIAALAVCAAASFAAPAYAQERNFTVTLAESQWNTVARVMSKAKGEWSWDDINPIMQAITTQVQQSLQGEAVARQQAANAANEVAKLKAEIERLNAAAPKPDAEAKPESP